MLISRTAPSPSHFRVFWGVVLIIFQDTQKLLSIVLSYSFIVNEIERICALNTLRLFLYLYQMLIKIPFLKKIDLFTSLVRLFLCNRRLSRSNTLRLLYKYRTWRVYEGPATIPHLAIGHIVSL